MLDTMRRHSGSAITTVIFGILILVFVTQFGAGSRGLRKGLTGQSGDHWAAFVNGELVAATDFNDRYAQRFQMMRRYRGEKYGLDEAKQDNLKGETLKGLEDRELLAQSAEKLGISVTDDELFKKLSEEPSFQKDGKFDAEAYKNYLQYAGTSPEKFEERLRRDLLAQKMTQVAIQGAAVSTDELKAEWERQNDTATFGYVRFTGLQFRDLAKPTDADIDAYLKTDHVKVEEQYEKTKFLYTQPHAMKVSVITVNTPPGSDDDAAKKKIEDAAAQVKSGKDFAEVAKAMSDDASKASGGDIGFVSPGRTIYGKALETEAGKLKVSEVSAPFKDKTGWHLLKATEERAATTKELKDVERELARDLLRDTKAKELAKSKAEETLAELKTGKKLEELWPAKEKKEGAPQFDLESLKKPTYAESGAVHPEGGNIPMMGSVPHVAEQVFALTADHPMPDKVVEDQDAYFVVELKARTRPDPAKFTDDEAKKTKERLEGQKRGQLYAAWLEKLRKGAKIEENPSMLAYSGGEGVERPDGEDY